MKKSRQTVKRTFYKQKLIYVRLYLRSLITRFCNYHRQGENRDILILTLPRSGFNVADGDPVYSAGGEISA